MLSPTAKEAVNVSITSDLVCPWCWVGLRKLQQASQESGVAVKIHWKPYMLRPNSPVDGVPKGGSPASRAGKHLHQAGESVGINFTGLTDRTPNTTLFHATLKFLQDTMKFTPETVTEFHEAVFEGYFTLGVFPDKEGIMKSAKRVTDPNVHESIAQLYKTAPVELAKLQNQVIDEAVEESRRGVSGVPTFVFNGHYGFSGAQPIDVFVRYLKSYAEDQRMR